MFTFSTVDPRGVSRYGFFFFFRDIRNIYTPYDDASIVHGARRTISTRVVHNSICTHVRLCELDGNATDASGQKIGVEPSA